MTLHGPEIEQLSGLIEELSIEEVEQIYLPLSRLLNLLRRGGAGTALDHPASSAVATRQFRSFIGIAGSVAVGRARRCVCCSALLARWPDHPRVDLITTDGFLHPNAELESRGLTRSQRFS